jgi:Cdc6-like AAA superfamily ATPase
MIPKNIEQKHVIQAIAEIERSGVRYHRESVRYNLIYQDKPYPPKYVLSVANKYANGRELEPSEFSGGPETNDFLRELGFSISDSGVGNNYWLDIFTATTWKEFRDAGAHTSGFPQRRRNTVKKVQPGDIFLCYVTGVSRWVGALEVIGPSSDDRTIWKDGIYPSRLEVRPLILLEPEDGVRLAELEGHVSFFEGPSDRPAYKFFLRSSPNLFKRQDDAEFIFTLLKEAERNRTARPLPQSQETTMTPSKHYWVEKTLVKGRADRVSGDYAVGSALWSPQKGKTGRNIYSAMHDVQPGDVILHLTDNKGISGVSVAASSADPSFIGLQGTDWEGMPSYLIRLEDYMPLDPPLNREEFLGDPAVFAQLARILEQHTGKGLFYNRDHELNQGAYLTEAPAELVGILNNLYQKKTGRNLPHADVAPLSSPQAEPILQPQYTLDDLLEETGFEKTLVDKWIRSLNRKKHIIIQGPPGTGKTYVAERLARFVVSETVGFYETIQFHPTYAYEDFIQGIHPRIEGGALSYEVKGGRFLEFCTKASDRGGAPCVLIIDEINRANLSRVFGELMYLLEYRDKTIPLTYGGEFTIPENVYLIGTMNTADRSIALVDHAFRRRFSFIYLAPDYGVLQRYLEEYELPADSLISVLKLINTAIDDPHYEVGISFFLKDGARLKETLQDVWHGEIEPYLEEYFYDRPEKAEPFRWEHLIEKDLADWAP